MQRQFTIELRVDYADPGKNEAMRTALCMAARQLMTKAELLADAIKPQISIMSDDFFVGSQEIKMFDDLIGKAVEAGEGGEESEVSEEMLQAMRDLQHDANNANNK